MYMNWLIFLEPILGAYMLRPLFLEIQEHHTNESRNTILLTFTATCQLPAGAHTTYCTFRMAARIYLFMEQSCEVLHNDIMQGL